MIRDVDLIQYLPPIIQEYTEMQRIAAAENPEFHLVWEADERIRDDLFIVTATEQGLKRFEKILGIYPSSQDTNESRRGRILSRWNDMLPYTLKALWGKIAVLAGDDFEINPDFNNYLIEIITHIGYFGGIDDLAYILDTVVPCNLVIVSNNELDCLTSGNLRLSGAIIPTLVYLITNDFAGNYQINGAAATGSTLVQEKVELITNDFNGTFSAVGEIKTGSNAEVVSEILITNDFNSTVTVNGAVKSGSATVITTEYQI
jgi:hypothetical protein